MRFFSLLFLFVSVLSSFGQSLIGAWERTDKPDLVEEKSYMIITDGFVVTTTVEAETGGFIRSRLEEWTLFDSSRFNVQLVFDTEYPEAEGGEYDAEISVRRNSMILDGEEWIRVDEGSDSKLTGIWKMTGVTLEGKKINLGLNHPRREIKILSGTRFQWIDYDKNSRTFTASGGGTYELKNNVYTEHIEFLTNEPEWIGSSISFQFKVSEGKWYHIGKGEDGVPIDEVWTRLN
ncbi:MAG: DUF4488 domain-containing protein [Cyclobacteriaceae bacterium]